MLCCRESGFELKSLIIFNSYQQVTNSKYTFLVGGIVFGAAAYKMGNLLGAFAGFVKKMKSHLNLIMMATFILRNMGGDIVHGTRCSGLYK